LGIPTEELKPFGGIVLKSISGKAMAMLSKKSLCDLLVALPFDAQDN